MASCLPGTALAEGHLLNVINRMPERINSINADNGLSSALPNYPVLRLGVWLPAHPPFIMDYAPQTEFEGITADYATLLSQMLGLKLQVTLFDNRQSAVQALKNKQIDLLPSDETPNLSDGDLVYSSAWLYDSAVIAHQPEIRLNDPQVFRGKTLLYIGDAQLRSALQSDYPEIKLQQQTDYISAMQQVYDNPDYIMWINRFTAAGINKQIFQSYLVLSSVKSEGSLNLSFTALRQNDTLIAAINQAIAAVPASMFDQLMTVWDIPANHEAFNKRAVWDTEKIRPIIKPDALTVFVDNNSAPLASINRQGEAEGIIADLLKNLAASSGISIRFQHVDSLSAMRSKVLEQPNSLIAVADASAKQDPRIAYSHPYLSARWVLVTRKGHPAVTSLADMSGGKIAVFPGTYYLPSLRKAWPQVEFVETRMSLKTMLQLSSGSIDGVIVPSLVIEMFSNSFLENFFRVAKVMDLPPVRMALATSASNTKILSVINQAIENAPPRTMVANLQQWQQNHPLSSLSLWHVWKHYFFAAGVVVILLIAFFMYRNVTLKKNLSRLQNLQAKLEAATREAEQASASKSIFLAQMSHEIRTPMNALIGLLELESLGHSSPQQRQNNIMVAYQSSKSLLMLVGDILDLAKIESGTLNVRHIPVSLPELMNAVTTLFRHNADEKQLVLHVTLELTNETIYFDPVMLKQILSNLLSNAIKFTGEGSVEVALYQAQDVVDGHGQFVLEVCDSGVGLNEHQQRAIFEPFVQVEDSPSKLLGTGLGLSICRNLAEMLGGELRVESEPGQGATFIFRFDAQICHEEATAPVITNGQNSFNILIVDDHAPNRLLLSQQLAFAGHKSVAAEDGEQAIRIWKQTAIPFDVVITDCNMPVMNGFDLVRQLRVLEKRELSAPIPMFGLTAMAEQDVASRALDSGMTACLFKPLELATLLNKIAESRGLFITHESSPPEQEVILTLKKMAKDKPRAFADLIQTVIAQNELDISKIEQDLAQQDFASIKITAHNILGSARIMGVTRLEFLAGLLENAAENEVLTEVISAFDACKEYIQLLETDLKHALNNEDG